METYKTSQYLVSLITLKYSTVMKLHSVDVVAPVFNNFVGIKDFVEAVYTNLEELGYKFRIILVDDGSDDSTWNVICGAAVQYPQVLGVRLQKNFGQHKAIVAGLNVCDSDVVVVMDSDMQDDPAVIPKLLKAFENSNESIVIKYKSRQGLSLLYRIQQVVFYRVLNFLIDFTYDPQLSNFGAYSSEMIKVVANDRAPYPFFPAQVLRSGLPFRTLEETRNSRDLGQSQYTLTRKVKHGLGIVFGQSSRIIYLTGLFGIVTSTVAFLFSLFILIHRFLHESSVQNLGWHSLAALISFLSGLILLSLSVVGVYLNWLLRAVVQAPRFVVEKTTESKL